MSWLPGWNTIDGAHAWENVFFWGGIIALILLGVMEVVSHRAAQRKDELTTAEQQSIQQKHDEDMAALHLQAANLEKEAATANERAANAELKLAEFRRTRRAILELPGSVAAFVNGIKPFAGTKFDIGHGPEGHREQWDFLWTIEPLFKEAGWVFVDWSPKAGSMQQRVNWTWQPHWYGLSNVLNVSIEMDPSDREKLLPAAQALRDILRSLGIETTIEEHIVSSQSATADAIHFMVGDKQ